MFACSKVSGVDNVRATDYRYHRKTWLGYRMRSGKGKKSSPLDDIRPRKWTAQFTTELLELFWVLEYTLAQYPTQAKLLDAVLAGQRRKTPSGSGRKKKK